MRCMLYKYIYIYICNINLYKRSLHKLREARFWHRPSVHPYFSREIKHFPSFGKPDFGTDHLSTPTFLEKFRIFQASESFILAPPICEHSLVWTKIAFSKLWKARFRHRPSVHPHFSREISHFPRFGKLDFGTAHLSTPTCLEKYCIFQASES